MAGRRGDDLPILLLRMARHIGPFAEGAGRFDPLGTLATEAAANSSEVES